MRVRKMEPSLRKAKTGGAEGDRTPDLVIANDALSQLSYGPVPVPERRQRLRESAPLSEKVSALPAENAFLHPPLDGVPVAVTGGLLAPDQPLRRTLLAKLAEEPTFRTTDAPVDAVTGALRLAASAANSG